ncbi:hypothetical protein ESCO_001887 [Escovopsis weberi]|uniref:N-acetyltransferase domain-containing protein n=1 Tax=Escovopsis weberi TaxID=150374 RepID=A0A0M8N726_ESCWE|nr:hypothetical protein ESCO_001887 [Escovopsis weberi]
MPLKVVPASEADAARSAAIEAIAYGPTAVSRVLFPGPFPSDGSSRVDVLVQQLRADPACRWLKVVDTDLADRGEEDMVAFAKWYIWEGEPIYREPTWGPGTNPEMCDAFFGEMTRRWWERYERRPHLYLKLLHTDPEHQRRGAAGMLLDWGTAEADRLGLESYLESSPQGYGLYLKYGFEEVGRHTVDLSDHGETEDATAVLMMRKPRALSEEA